MLSTTEFIVPQINSTFLIILNSALLIKIGAAPFHFWFPEVMEGLNWFNCLIILTWQKIAPIILVINNQLNIHFFTIIILFSLIVRRVINFNQIRLRKILTYSSINHIAWIIASILISTSLWLIYFIIYSLITFTIVIIFIISNSLYVKQVSNILYSKNLLKFTLIIRFLSLGGLPPFIGFLPKWLTINWLIFNNQFTLTLILILFTIIILYIYIRLILSSLLLSYSETKIKTPIPIKFTLNVINFFIIVNLIFCTYLINFL